MDIRPLFAAALIAASWTGNAGAELAFRDLEDLSIEELASIRITSVAREETSLHDAAASVFVLTNEDLRRSGVTTLPEALRLAPNLQVARSNSVGYAITARGFNNAVGNKLLVLIDGRVVYTPVYSGVFWEMQDVMLEDVDRIEVISGPGATLWGANAVNGVINVITRSARRTVGTLAAAELGTDERGAALRVGFAAGEHGAFRVYARTREWDRTRDAPGARDEWRRHQAGFRGDWDLGTGSLTVQGDAYDGGSEHRGFIGALEIRPHTVSGQNLLVRFTRPVGRGDIRVQAYWDHIAREEQAIFQPEVDTIDIDLQHALPVGGHRLIWGGGVRQSQDETTPGFFSTFYPERRTLRWANAFAQADLRLADDIGATLGLKLEHNSYTGLEHLPTARLAWQPADAHTVWASASRAVRTPARFDRDVFFPQDPPFVVAGGPDFVSEVADVFELGYRTQPGANVSFSITGFHHDWDRLRSGTGLPLPINLVNNIEGRVHGVESWATLQLTPGWRLMAGALVQDKHLRFRPGATPDTAGTDNATLHNDPEFQWNLRSRSDLGRFEFDWHLRRVGALEVQPVPAYTEFDIRIGWRVSPDVDLSLTGRNLWNTRHAEFGAAPNRSEFEREIVARVEWRF